MTVCPEAILRVANHAVEKNKHFMMNLAAPFISQFFSDRLNKVLPYVDILFANIQEALAYAKYNNWSETEAKEIGLKLAAFEKVWG